MRRLLSIIAMVAFCRGWDLNTRTVQLFMRGDVSHAAHMARRAWRSRNGSTIETITAAKNLVWIQTVQNHPRLEESTSALYSLLSAHHSGANCPPPRRNDTVGVSSIFELPMQRRLCDEPAHARNLAASGGGGAFSTLRDWRARYLDLLKRSLTDYLYQHGGGGGAPLWEIMQKAGGHSLVQVPPYGHSLTQAGNLNHLQLVVEDVLQAGVEGDVLHAGCFRGGGGVLLRAALGDDTSRALWVADTFSGIPPPSTEQGERVDETQTWEERYSASQEEVEQVFHRHGMLPDPQIRFLEGPFRATLTKASVAETIFSVIHIDADAYDSILDVLNATYHRLSPRGYVVVDDIHLRGVREALTVFRRDHGIRAPLLPVPLDYTSTCFAGPVRPVGGLTLAVPVSTAYWQKG